MNNEPLQRRIVCRCPRFGWIVLALLGAITSGAMGVQKDSMAAALVPDHPGSAQCAAQTLSLSLPVISENPTGSIPGEMLFHAALVGPAERPSSPLDTTYVPWEAKRRPVAAITEIAILEFIPWALAKWIRDIDWADVSSKTWWSNLSKGWEYDGDNFLTNMFAHPYHGAMFYSAARSNGYTFWESIPFSLGGSMVWEYFGETFRPAFNDWVNTGVTGVSFGETLYRLSIMVTDNTVSGSERVWREIGGTLINPVRGFNRLLSGEMWREFPNPPERSPKAFTPTLMLGLRRMDADGTDLVKDALTQGFFGLALDYGSLPRGDYASPFSWFRMDLALAFPNRTEDSTGIMQRVGIEGSLFGWELSRDPSAVHILSVHLIYDYVSNPAFDFGQTATGAQYSLFSHLSESWDLTASFGVRTVLMGATPSDYYQDKEGRNYDFGPGFGASAGIALVTGGWDVVSLGYNGGWIWTMSEPSESKHNFHTLALGLRYPFSTRLALTLRVGMYWRESYYERIYYDRIQPPPAQEYAAELKRHNPIALLGLTWAAW